MTELLWNRLEGQGLEVATDLLLRARRASAGGSAGRCHRSPRGWQTARTALLGLRVDEDALERRSQAHATSVAAMRSTWSARSTASERAIAPSIRPRDLDFWSVKPRSLKRGTAFRTCRRRSVVAVVADLAALDQLEERAEDPGHALDALRDLDQRQALVGEHLGRDVEEAGVEADRPDVVGPCRARAGAP